jgi:hypothetical protein
MLLPAALLLLKQAYDFIVSFIQMKPKPAKIDTTKNIKTTTDISTKLIPGEEYNLSKFSNPSLEGFESIVSGPKTIVRFTANW